MKQHPNKEENVRRVNGKSNGKLKTINGNSRVNG